MIATMLIYDLVYLLQCTQTNNLHHTCILYHVAEFPNNTTVFMNQRALFRCVAPGTPLYMYWKVNGTAFNQLESDIRGDMGTEQVTVGDNEELTLTIPGRAEYNGTRVQCVAGDEGGEDESENATLSIQGIPQYTHL